MTRWSASALHLAISMLVALLFVAVLRFVWFPGPLFAVSGATGLLSILVPVDVVLGPLLTLLVFKAGKPSLKFDLTVIALLQAAALCYGAWVIAEARPAYMVFFGNQLHVVRSTDLAENKPWQAPLTGPQWVGIPAESALASELESAMAAMMGKPPMTHDLERYRPFAEFAEQFSTALKEVGNVQPSAAVATLRAEVAARGLEEGAVRVLPISVRDQRMTAVFSADDKTLLAIVPVTLLAQ